MGLPKFLPLPFQAFVAASLCRVRIAAVGFPPFLATPRPEAVQSPSDTGSEKHVAK